MKMNWNSPVVLAGATMAVLSALIVLHKIGDLFCLSPSDWASWVQAVGSIVAIAVAIQISRKAAEEQLKKERDYPLRNLRVIAERAERMINAAPSTLTEVAMMEYRIANLMAEMDTRAYRDVARALHEFPLSSLQDDHAVEAVFEMRLAMADYCDLIEEVADRVNRDEMREALIDNLYPIEECQERFNQAMVHLQVALDGAGIR